MVESNVSDVRIKTYILPPCNMKEHYLCAAVFRSNVTRGNVVWNVCTCDCHKITNEGAKP